MATGQWARLRLTQKTKSDSQEPPFRFTPTQDALGRNQWHHAGFGGGECDSCNGPVGLPAAGDVKVTGLAATVHYGAIFVCIRAAYLQN
jgi:hypothetical protein